MNKDELIDIFNETILDFANQIAYIAPTSIIANNISDINKTLKNKIYRTVFIDKFVLNILIYKKKFEDNDESFFMDDAFTKKVISHKEVKNTKADEKTIMNKIFELKSVWKTFSLENKNIIFEYMRVLCDLAQQYFIICDNI